MSQLVNPIVDAVAPCGSADPSVVFHNGFYYYCKSISDGAIAIGKAARLQDIGRVPLKTIWTAPLGTAYSSQVWAPELQFVRGRFYVYFAASDGNNETHRMYALQSEGDDPQGPYSFEGRMTPPTDEWAIDGTSFEHDGQLYFVWSGWRAAGDGFPQVTYIARMADPLTIVGDRHEIASPELEWEMRGAPLMEGHAILQRDGKIHMIYSASASWTDDYTLGMLTCDGGDLLDPASWKKHPQPVFARSPENGVHGPGHNTFVKSPDGSEDWIVYHAIDNAGGGWGQRSVRAQPFEWSADGTPRFGVPVAQGVAIAEPAGSPSLVEFIVPAVEEAAAL